MPNNVLILSRPQDLHAHVMCEALERKSISAQFFNTPDFPSRMTLTIQPTQQGVQLGTNEASLGDLAETTSVWLRRPSFGKIPDDFAEDDRKMIERECRDMRASFFDLLCPSALWVNPFRRLSEDHWKPNQLVEAQLCGLSIPKTLVSNDPVAIMKFVESAGGPVVYKTFNSLVSTSLITEELLSEPDVLRWTPGIYQQYVDKDHELRVTVIGRRVFAARINSQQTSRGKIDWRDAQWQRRGSAGDLAIEAGALPRRVERSCLRLVRRLGLAYGAIDLIVTPENEYVFLEINPSGQFLWVEHAAGLPLLDAMTEMLIQGRIDYAWEQRTPGIRLDGELLGAAEERLARSMAEHVTELQV